MGYCSACRFWNRNGVNVYDPHDEEYEGPEPDTNAQTPRSGDRKRCLRILHRDQYDTPASTTVEPALLTDGSGYAAALWTAGEFSCSLFEEQT